MLTGGSDPLTYISRIIILVMAISVHEFAHALTANWLGDPTPRSQGRLTLDPRKHLDPFGSIMLILAGFGWGKPVYTDPRYFRTDARTGMAMVAAAGPLSNLLMAYLASFPMLLGLIPTEEIRYSILFCYFKSPEPLHQAFCASLSPLTHFIGAFIVLNLILMVFNLLPLAPLDGYRVAVGLLPDEWFGAIARYEKHGPIILMLLVAVPFIFKFSPLWMIITPPLLVLMNLLLPT